MSKKLLQGLSAALVVSFAALQFVRPAQTNLPVDPARTMQAHTQMTPEIEKIFARACRDCHSHETAWPWYSHIAPASWLVADDVRIGRGQLNFSEWAGYDARTQDQKLEAVCEVVEIGSMPLRPYIWLHLEAVLSENERRAVCDWTKAERNRLNAGAAD